MAISIKANIDNVIKGLDQEKVNAEKVVRRTMGDMRSRGPGWVSKAVKEEYNISNKDNVVNQACHVETAGSTTIAGTSVDNVSLIYKGRSLTYTHFGMKSKVSGKKGVALVPSINITPKGKVGPVATIGTPAPKTISVTVKRGITHILHGKSRNDGLPFLLRSGGKGTKEIPFQREGKNRYPLVALKTVSVPQMIQDGEGNTKPKVAEAINTGLEKRFEHYCKRYLEK